ncbi:hypothetical protein ACIBW9_33435 [Streptomyces sp. NPDC049541]|uniref:hypothetical protein n=1 Tax=Streptomyces sp. NPDC049541 TaxID=3365594 RepID=UPI003789A267
MSSASRYKTTGSWPTADLFQVNHTEVGQALTDVMLAWVAGSTPVGSAHVRKTVAERKRMLDALAGRPRRPRWALSPRQGARARSAISRLVVLPRKRCRATSEPDRDHVTSS